VAVLARGHVGARAVLPQGLMLTLGYEAATLAAVGHVAPRPHWPRVTAPLAVAVPGCAELPAGDWRIHTALAVRQALPAGWERNPDPYVAYLDADLLGARPILRPRRPGDRIVPLGLGHAQLVRELMINAKIPAAERASVPLLVARGAAGEGPIAWVVGWRLGAACAVTPATTRVAIVRLEALEV
ncbi:MAG: tRNA lysidine(34) synthetase TilS, partial [Chloroflexota bacterium]